MSYARPGSTVTIRYIGTLENGRIFAHTDECGSLTFTIGAEEVFPALEGAIVGMRAGEAKNLVLTASEAYGPRLPENILTLPRHSFPVEKEIVAGQKISIEFANGEARIMRVMEVTTESVTLDGNHPLAGCELTFALQLERVEE